MSFSYFIYKYSYWMVISYCLMFFDNILINVYYCFVIYAVLRYISFLLKTMDSDT